MFASPISEPCLLSGTSAFTPETLSYDALPVAITWGTALPTVHSLTSTKVIAFIPHTEQSSPLQKGVRVTGVLILHAHLGPQRDLHWEAEPTSHILCVPDQVCII